MVRSIPRRLGAYRDGVWQLVRRPSWSLPITPRKPSVEVLSLIKSRFGVETDLASWETARALVLKRASVIRAAHIPWSSTISPALQQSQPGTTSPLHSSPTARSWHGATMATASSATAPAQGLEICQGPIPCSTLPVQVSGLSGVVAISASQLFSLALLSNGSVMSWGYNNGGTFGQWGQQQRQRHTSSRLRSRCHGSLSDRAVSQQGQGNMSW